MIFIIFFSNFSHLWPCLECQISNHLYRGRSRAPLWEGNFEDFQNCWVFSFIFYAHALKNLVKNYFQPIPVWEVSLFLSGSTTALIRGLLQDNDSQNRDPEVLLHHPSPPETTCKNPHHSTLQSIFLAKKRRGPICINFFVFIIYFHFSLFRVSVKICQPRNDNFVCKKKRVKKSVEWRDHERSTTYVARKIRSWSEKKKYSNECTTRKLVNSEKAKWRIGKKGCRFPFLWIIGLPQSYFYYPIHGWLSSPLSRSLLYCENAFEFLAAAVVLAF